MEDGVVDLDVERAFRSCCPCGPGCDRSEFESSHVPRTGGDRPYLQPQAITFNHLKSRHSLMALGPYPNQ